MVRQNLVVQERDETLARVGDAQSFTELYRRYVVPIRSYLRAHLPNLDDTDDTTSAVFTRAWSKRRTYGGTGSFRSWLFAIAHRAIADYYRQRRRPVRLSGQVEALRATAGDPEAAFEDGEQWQLLRSLLGGLTAEQREVLFLRFWPELSYGEIGQIVGKSEGAVKMQAYRALQQLRRRFPDGC